MRGTPPALQIAAENFPPRDVARSESGELSKDRLRPSTLLVSLKELELDHSIIINYIVKFNVIVSLRFGILASGAICTNGDLDGRCPSFDSSPLSLRATSTSYVYLSAENFQQQFGAREVC